MQLLIYAVAALGLVAAASGAIISARDGIIGKADDVDHAGASCGDRTTARKPYRRRRSTLTGPVLVFSGVGLEFVALVLQMMSR